ncbi:Elongator subunit elp2 [Vanrija albida]|uniref:Elongator complex protein 2 n=1 Tax=Vanrija albida TaxID=181172 RepID=A0ABR3Q977_9TREE
MPAALTTAYISIGANRSSSGSACSSTGIFAYAADSTVALWDTNGARGVYATLLGHRGAVTTLKVVSEHGGRVVFVSGDAVGGVRLWAEGEGRQFTCTASFVAHEGASISALAVLPTPAGAPVELLTGDSSANVKRWRIAAGEAEHVESLEMKGRLPLDMEVAVLPGSSQPVLAIGATDRKVQIWTLRDGEFWYTTSLEGHEDWIRCLSFTPYPALSGAGTDLLLATGSQDNYIRLWRITPAAAADEGLDILDEFERRLGGEDGGVLSTKAHVLSVDEGGRALKFNITLEALLVGHESGLTNVHWSPATAEGPAILLSSASDNSLVIWAPTAGEHTRDGIWVPEHRFGAFGGRGLAFFGAVWGPGAGSVLTTGWTGGVERWVRGPEGWDPRSAVTGHFGPVHSVAWDGGGDYIVSASADQTSRIHAACASGPARVWGEIARPQIHGYDLVDAAFVTPLRVASAAEEKVLRVFDATEGFAESLTGLGVRSTPVNGAHLPKGATVPPLGLSNRALGRPAELEAVGKLHVSNEARDSVSAALSTLPTEEELGTSTLWPEIEKVYGHGYELSTLAASNGSAFVATASRASSAEHAAVRVVSTADWGLVSTLPGHSLTVTRVAFSPDDALLLTVSRDRSWRLFARSGEGYVPAAAEERAHARMILDCAWAPSGARFATAGRDKSVKVWERRDGVWAPAAVLKLDEPATAVALAAGVGGDLLAVGTESGGVAVYGVADGAVTPLAAVPPAEAHAGAVHRLAWHPSTLTLASAGADRAVRVFTLV